MCSKVGNSPMENIIIIIIRITPVISTSSNIIIYSISLIITVIKVDIKIRDIIPCKVSPKT